MKIIFHADTGTYFGLDDETYIIDTDELTTPMDAYDLETEIGHIAAEHGHRIGGGDTTGLAEYLIGTLDADEVDRGYRILHALNEHFGFSGSTFSREDVASLWEQWHPMSGESMPEGLWDAVRDTYYWRKGLPERLTEHGWDIVEQALNEAESTYEGDK